MGGKGGDGRCGDGEWREVRRRRSGRKGECGGGGCEGRKKKEDMGVGSTRREEDLTVLCVSTTEHVPTCRYCT